MLGFIGQTIEGGWNAIANITAGIGKGASTLVSGFFPTPQRETVVSEIVQPAGGAGTTYRFVVPDAPSLVETAKWFDQGWLGSPYESQFAIPAKIEESQQLAATISTETQRGPVETIVDVFGKFTIGATQIRTAADEFMEAWGLKPREPISEGPKETGASRGVIQNLDDLKTVGAQVVTWFKGAGSAMLDQVKGLFNLGYEPTGSQPAFTIQHELDPKTKITIGIAVAGIIIALLLLSRKK